jgi:hypothetical protein
MCWPGNRSAPSNAQRRQAESLTYRLSEPPDLFWRCPLELVSAGVTKTRDFASAVKSLPIEGQVAIRCRSTGEADTTGINPVARWSAMTTLRLAQH